MSNPLQKSLEEAFVEVTAPGEDMAVEEEEIRGVRYQVFKNYSITLRDLYQRSLAEFQDQPFVVYEELRWTFAETGQQAAQFAEVLHEQFSVQKGDRVAIAMRNYPEWLVSFMAITSLGAIVVPMNAWWTTKELEYGLEDSGSVVVVVDQERLERLAPLIGHKPFRVIAVRCEDPLPEPVTSYEQMMAGRREQTLPEVAIDPDEDALLMYTSGSTGFPKGVISTHRSVIFPLVSWKVLTLVQAMVDGIDLLNPDPDAYPPTVLVTSPLFHAAALHGQFLLSLFFGAKAVLMYKWDAEKALALIENERITYFNGVPTMSWEMLRSPNFEKYDLSSLHFIVGAGQARPPEHVKHFEERLPGYRVATGWGLTETNAIGSTNSRAEYVQKPASVGMPHPLAFLKIVDEHNQEVAVGESGEVLIKSAANARGYWNQPEATAQAFQEGWFRTGDIGYLDQEGFLYIVDRAKDIVIRGGENISCLEVEAAIYQHPAVLEAAVFGIPEERLGEAVYAVVMVRPKTPIDAAALQTFLQERLASFKIPQYFEFRTDPLPRTGTEKIHKRQLREEMLAKVQKSAGKGGT